MDAHLEAIQTFNRVLNWHTGHLNTPGMKRCLPLDNGQLHSTFILLAIEKAPNKEAVFHSLHGVDMYNFWPYISEMEEGN